MEGNEALDAIKMPEQPEQVEETTTTSEEIVTEEKITEETTEEIKSETPDYKKMFEEFYKDIKEKEKTEIKEEVLESKKEPKDHLEQYMEEISKAKIKQLDYHLEKVCMKERFPDQFKQYIKYDKNTSEKEIETQIESFSTALKGYTQSIIDEKKSGGIKLGGKGTTGSNGVKKELNFGEMIAKEIYGGGK